ncbi:MAG: multicopper oxidase domain-containing protein [Acidobacteria bacterium]|nr:multicopper oxidase domain-containing protein [Acidobacteriota bacterium]
MTKSNDKQNVEAISVVASPQQSNQYNKLELAARREFMIKALAATSGLAFSSLLPTATIEATAQTQSCPPTSITSPALQAVGQITSQNGKLQAIMRVKNESRAVPGYSKPPMLRYFTGSRIDGSQVWPTRPGQPVPGPTLVAELGDVVQVALLNETKVSDFAGTLDLAESGQTSGTGCQSATLVDTTTNPPTTTNSYPGKFDQFPNCFHGSSTANLHFHGTHVTPEATGDNILFGVRPLANINERDALADLQAVFNAYDPTHPWHNWNDFMKSPAAQNWWNKQQEALAAYDKTSQWGNGFGLPPSEQLLPADTAAIAAGEWPPWFIGSFPNCYKIPRYTTDANGNPTGPLMGQAPGTHWYHAHKHGSTALNLFNGLAGAFIIRDSSPTGYDGKLQAVYQNKLKEFIMVFQEITDSINLLGGSPRATLVNGQKTPMITMQPGEVQLWRMLNTTVTVALTPQFATATAAGAPLAQFSTMIQDGVQFSCKQIAQDGVQFNWTNVDPNSPNGKMNGVTPVTMAPANRVDLLVKAPPSAGCYQLQSGKAVLLYINVTGSAVNPPMNLPQGQKEFPVQPSFLADLDPDSVRVQRTIKYAWENGRTNTGRINGAPPNFNIDGKKFDSTVAHSMHLNEVEMWTVTNNSPGVRHPFHIHQNPFQIIELFDPTTMDGPMQLPGPWVWWDTFAIPPASNTYPNGKPRLDGNGKQVYVNGYFKMLTRFADFTGKFVNHCHILGHEDRGMMQLIEVVPNAQPYLKHH